ncbi:MAG: PLP-dependent aminotransferase family protein [Bacillota bacterium]|nr:PLP-dependent aminotransferase family protein [Bacillota bacterium]
MRYKYETAADIIKQKIYSGVYKAGEKLPSIKRLSGELEFNPDTIVKAYKHLEEEHFIYSVPKSGYYVVKNEDKSGESRKVVDMLKASPPEEINPYKDFYHCMENAVSIYGEKLFEYSSPKGMTELINSLEKHLMNFQIFVKPENIYITNGSQQALYILAAMPFPSGKSKVLLEQPTYSLMLDIMRYAKTPAVGIERTSKGIDLNELEEIFKKGDIKFFYTMPRYQNPTGFSYDTRQKREILRLAEKYDVYIVEDDYLADLELDNKADPMYSLKSKDKVIYIRSFSKTLLPGLRLGAAILPQELHNDFNCFKYSMDLNTSIINQSALEVFLKSKMYKFHIKRTKNYYRKKMKALKNASLEYHNENITWYVPETGIYAYLETKNIKSEELVKSLLNSKVLVCSTTNCYLRGFNHAEGIRLCVCNASDEEIANAVQIIDAEVKKQPV